MSLNANVGRKVAPAVATTAKKEGDQGIRQLWPSEFTSGEKATGKQSGKNWEHEIDIVFVPGLGADPENSWQYPDEVGKPKSFNWAKSEDGLHRDVRYARLLLYTFESAWKGRFQGKEHLDHLAISLLRGLNSKRSNLKDKQKPMVLIGHSMGGLIIAKAIVIAQAQRTEFPHMFQSIGACFFFGTPFDGAEVATIAAMYAQVAEKFGKAQMSNLLDSLKPGNEELRMLKDDFLRVATRNDNPIELYCFYETKQTDFSQFKIPTVLLPLVSGMIPKKYADFVTMSSATLPGFPAQDLNVTHRNLVKFDSCDEIRYKQFVHDPILDKIKNVQQLVKRRLTADRGIDLETLRGIDDLLQGVQVKSKREMLKSALTPSDWITAEKEYLQWLTINMVDTTTTHKDGFGIYLCGREGRGKTNATLAVIEGVEKQIKGATRQQLPLLLIYFFCEQSAGCATAEDLLKSLILQLVHQEPTLAAYPKTFLSSAGESSDPIQKQAPRSKKPASQVTVENLWKCFQDMLWDPSLGKRLYVIINNLHVLPQDSDSTKKLMNYIAAELDLIATENFERTETRWFLTSRDIRSVSEKLKINGMRLIDLANEAYGNKVQLALLQHARLKVQDLKKEKDYNRALTYFASSLIGKRAENTQWIDIISVLLQQLSKDDSDLKVRKRLEAVPQDLKTLLNLTWQQIFNLNLKTSEEIKEMLRTLVLTYEDPTESELGVLAGFRSTEQHMLDLRLLVDQCKPLLFIEETSGKEYGTVCFLNSVVKAHLLSNANELLGLSPDEVKWQHGVIAHRSFTHINQVFSSEDLNEQLRASKKSYETTSGDDVKEDDNKEQPDSGEEEGEEEADDEDQEEDAENDGDDEENGVDGDNSSDGDANGTESDDYWDDDDDEQTRAEHAILKDRALPYTVKHWLHHASKATTDIADDLSSEERFWEQDSRIRRSWLFEFSRLTDAFGTLTYIKKDPTITALHISASVGFSDLTAALIKQGHGDDLHVRDDWLNTPLHLAARFGRANTTEILLKHGARKDDGIEEREETPMHMAAYTGQTGVVARLIDWGADCNAICEEGPVLNFAILSGNKDTVEQLMSTGKAALTFDDDADFPPPLAMAALRSNYSMFQYVLSKCPDLPPREYSRALFGAAENGDEEIFKRLLEFGHGNVELQAALVNAAAEESWHIIRIMLERFPALDYDEAFKSAAINNDDLNSLLKDIWSQTNGKISPEALNDSLFQATDYQKTSTVELLLNEFKANPNATGVEYGTALTAAAYDGNLEILHLLLAAGADVNSTDGWALQTAATEGHMEIVKELLNRDADVNMLISNESFSYGTAIQGATENGNLEMVQHLLKHGADPNLGSGEWAPPLVSATFSGNDEILQCLLEAGADVNKPTDSGATALFGAHNVTEDSMRLLLDKGANVEASDQDGDTALGNIVFYQAYTAPVETLLDYGANLLHVNNEGQTILQMAFTGAKENLGNDMDVVELLIDRMAPLMQALKSSMDAGNSTVTSLVKNAGISTIKPHDGEHEQKAVPVEDHGTSADGRFEEASDQGNAHQSNTDFQYASHDEHSPIGRPTSGPLQPTQNFEYVDGLIPFEAPAPVPPSTYRPSPPVSNSEFAPQSQEILAQEPFDPSRQFHASRPPTNSQSYISYNAPQQPSPKPSIDFNTSSNPIQSTASAPDPRYPQADSNGFRRKPAPAPSYSPPMSTPSPRQSMSSLQSQSQTQSQIFQQSEYQSSNPPLNAYQSSGSPQLSYQSSNAGPAPYNYQSQPPPITAPPGYAAYSRSGANQQRAYQTRPPQQSNIDAYAQPQSSYPPSQSQAQPQYYTSSQPPAQQGHQQRPSNSYAAPSNGYQSSQNGRQTGNYPSTDGTANANGNAQPSYDGGDFGPRPELKNRTSSFFSGALDQARRAGGRMFDGGRG